MSFTLNGAGFTPLLNSTTLSKPVSSAFASLPFNTLSTSFFNYVSGLSFKSYSNVTYKPFLRSAYFFPDNFAPKHIKNPQSLAPELSGNVPTKLEDHIC